MKNQVDIHEKLFLYYSTSSSIWQLIRKVFGKLSKKSVFEGRTDGVVFFNTVDRQDHKIFFETVKSQCQINKSDLKLNFKITINFKFIIDFFRYITNFKEFRYIEVINDVGNVVNKEKIIRRRSLSMYLEWVFNREIIDSFEKLDFSNTNAFVVLADVLNIEYILIKKMNEMSIETITCQHGIYSPDVTAKKIDILNFYKAPSKYVLTWGQASNELFAKYSPNIIPVICGNPVIKNEKTKMQKNMIGIAMDIPALKDYNQNMLGIVEEYARKNDYKIKIRLHPTDDICNYCINSEISCFDKDIINCEYIIAHTTTMLFTYLVYGKKTFRFNSEIPFYEIDKRICFDDLQGLTKCLKNEDNINFKRISTLYIQCFGEESRRLYKNFFDSLNNG